MPKMPISPSSLEIFAVAGRLQSFRHAADELFLTTSAVSQSIKRMEEQLGVKLFHRKGNRVNLTQEGLLLLQDVEAAFERIKSGLDNLRFRSQRCISISSPPGIANLLTPAVQHIVALDSWDVRIVCDESPNYMSYRDFDIALLYGLKAKDTLGLESLGPDVFLPVCNPNLSRSIVDLETQTRLVLLVNETSPVTWEEWFQFNKKIIPKATFLKFNRAAHLVAAAIDGHGVALESLRILSPYLRNGSLVVLDPGSYQPIIENLAHLYVRDAGAKPHLDKVAALIRQQCTTESSGMLRSLF